MFHFERLGQAHAFEPFLGAAGLHLYQDIRVKGVNLDLKFCLLSWCGQRKRGLSLSLCLCLSFSAYHSPSLFSLDLSLALPPSLSPSPFSLDKGRVDSFFIQPSPKKP